MWSQCMVKYHRILKFLFSTTPSGSCSYQSLALLNLSFSQNYHSANLPTLSCLFVLLLGKFTTFTHYMRYSLISCTTHPTKGWHASFVNIALDIVSLYRLFLGTNIKGSMHPFKLPFLIHLHVLFLSLSSISLANCPCILFAVHSFFFVLL